MNIKFFPGKTNAIFDFTLRPLGDLIKSHKKNLVYDYYKLNLNLFPYFPSIFCILSVFLGLRNPNSITLYVK